MTDDGDILTRFDEWLHDDSEFAALIMRQILQPAGGPDSVIFPPTYTLRDTEIGRRFEEGERQPGVYHSKDGPYGYNIDRLEGGGSVCLLDSPGSQANRMEEIFMQQAYRDLVPQITVGFSRSGSSQTVNLLAAGHRIADAIVRFSTLSGEARRAFESVRQGDAVPMAKLAPTSIVFGAWDSRDTGVKLQRIVRATIRAFNVEPLHRSAQYIPPVDYVAMGVVEEPKQQERRQMSEHGLLPVPAPWGHGGVLVRGEIRREASLNLVALRALRSSDPGAVLPLRRYILGLSLVAITGLRNFFLREGCELVPDPERPAQWHVVRFDGKCTGVAISHAEAREYAERAAKEFGVGPSRCVQFDPERARTEIGVSPRERRRGRKAAQEDLEEAGAGGG